MRMLYITKLIFIIILVTLPLLSVFAQQTNNEEIQPAEDYKHTIGWDMFSVNYSYAFLRRKIGM